MVDVNDAEAWLEHLELLPDDLRDGRWLRAIALASNQLDGAQENLVQAIRDARRAGDTWEAIGLVLGTSKQAAHRKYSAAEVADRLIGLGGSDPNATVTPRRRGATSA